MFFAFALVLASLVAPLPSAPSPVSSVAAAAVASACPSPSPSRRAASDATPPAANVTAPAAMPSTATPPPRPVASLSPAPCGGLAEIARASTVGRKANLVGHALAASEGTIGPEEIATRPLTRPGDVLEAIPGLVISQHSGEGKANQYYLRGFQLDHGTDLESTFAGVPVNLPTHAHGQGYSDINYLIPELVSYVEFKKGTYYADQGDFSTAGSYTLFYRNEIAPTLSIATGDFGYDRLFAATTIPAGTGKLLTALEVYHDNGTYVKPDQFHKVNGVLRYSRTGANDDLAVTGIGYNGAFDSTDQIPQRLIDDGTLGHYGYVDPSDGGNTYRYALSAQYEHRDPHGRTDLDVYGVKSFLDLFSNFTYDLDDATDYYDVHGNPVTCDAAYVTCVPNAGGRPRADAYRSYCPANDTAPAGAAPRSVVPAPFAFACGDQREQVDDRVYGGFALTHTFESPGATSTVGIGVRTDNASTVGLYLDRARVRFPLGTLSSSHDVVRDSDLYLQSDLRFGRLRSDPGLRGDVINYKTFDAVAANTGAATAALLSPKLNVAFAFSKHQELYLDYGSSFHSNDARGVIDVDDPQTRATIDPSGERVGQNMPVTRGYGEEAGYRFSTQKLTSTVSYYQLRLQDELVFDGDAGTTSLGGPTLRKGIEFANFYTPATWLTFDADVATATANFTTNPGDVGTAIPESLNNVDSLGVTVDEPRYAASVRMRYFGPRALENTGVFKSRPATVFNSEFTAKLRRRGRLELELLNLLNQQSDDVEYYYGSWTRQDAANPKYANDPAVNPALGGSGVQDYHVHPAPKRQVRLAVTLPL